MPRIIRNCRACTQKFIAKDFLIDLTCKGCQATESDGKDDPKTEIDDDIPEFDAGVSSEAEDDFHCTQLVEILSSDEDDEEEDEPLTSLIRPTPQQSIVYNPYSQSKPPAQKRLNHGEKEKRQEQVSIALQPPIEHKHQTSQQLTTCFVCGANLMETIQSGWKGRLDHIKRCSKKHGVQAKDVIEQPDEEFVVEHSVIEGGWHSGVSQPPAVVKQTTLQSLLPSDRKQSAPPNALSILMDGARRVAQQAKQPKETKQPRAQNNAKKRQWSSGPKHSSRTCPFYKKIPGTDFGTCRFKRYCL